MKKIILFIALFFVIGCVKEKNCENYREGVVVVLERHLVSDSKNKKVDALFFQTSTIDDIRNDSTLSRTPIYYIINRLPKDYLKGDTVLVYASFKREPKMVLLFGIPNVEVTCIERIY